MRPIIGVTADEGASEARPGRPSLPRYELKRAYADSLASAGGVPLILPFVNTEDVPACIDLLAGLVVTGGAFDIDPAEYGAAPHPRLGTVNKARTRSERALLEAALAKGLPVLGICGGMQLLNVVRGGTLVQDIASERPEALAHEQKHDPREPAHAVTIEPGSLLVRLCGSRLEVNSTHHQAVGAVGRQLRVTARAPDGIIEAIEDPEARFVVGVEWHPEILSDLGNRALIKAFVSAAAGNSG
jgi:putative glutamine amidotransferase